MNTALRAPATEKQYTPHRFTVKEYCQMAEATGIFNSANKVELLKERLLIGFHQ